MATLYNKYEPKNFCDVVGQEMTIKVLQALSKDVSKINGLILSGIHGVGKTLLAKIFSRAINCLEEHKPCNKCNNCLNFLNTSDNGIQHHDFKEIDGATYTGVDNIREILEDVYTYPMEHKYKICIIDETHMLSRSALDALLITLQNPPEHFKFIFATTRPDKLPETFASRCIHLHLNSVGETDIINNLKRICEKEKVELKDDIFKTVADASNFSVRRSISLLELLLLIDINITPEETLDYLKIFSISDCIKIMTMILDGLPGEAISLWSKFKKKGYDEKTFFHKFIKILINLSLVKLDKPVENEQIYKDLLNKYNISFNLLINFWEIIISQSEALYNGGYSTVETTIIMISLIEDRTDLIREVKRSFPTL